MIKLILKYLPYSIFLKTYYYYFDNRKKKFLNTLVQDDKYKILNIDNIAERKKSDKLFIIGSGYSINHITQEEWKEINKHDIFGFNFSFLNRDHVPTYYSMEAMIPIDMNSENRSPVADLFYKLYINEKERYKNVVKILSDIDLPRKNHVENYGRDFMDDNFFIINTVNGIADSEEKFDKMIKFYNKIGIFDKKKHKNSLFKFRATLSMAISFGIKMGYKEIILCGIDLDDPRYFYSNKTIYPHIPEFRSSKDTPKHATILNNPLFISIDKVVKILNDRICKSENIKLYVQNSSSALSSFLPVYNFKENQKKL